MAAPALSKFNKTMLEEYIFPGTDAAVRFVANDETVSPEITAVLKRSYQQRWFPVPGGHKVQIPYHFCKGSEDLFERQTKGWDHEHCTFCEESIGIGGLCWTAPAEGGVHIFCKNCREKLKNRPWWKLGKG
jgi:hypothetical protein